MFPGDTSIPRSLSRCWPPVRSHSIRAVSYIVAQLVGGVAGAGILTRDLPDLGELGRNNVGVNLGLPGLGPGITTTGALIMEIVMTFFLVLVIWGSAVDPRVPRGFGPFAIGLTITIDILAGGRVSGAAMNPARWFGPADRATGFHQLVDLDRGADRWWLDRWLCLQVHLVATRAGVEAAARRDVVDVQAPTLPIQQVQMRRRSSRRH